MKKIVCLLSILVVSISLFMPSTSIARDVWTAEEANAWYAKQPFRAGVNYIPAYAINPIEIWQKETFNLDVFEKEFALMESIGFNAIRLFLNDLVVNDDPKGFLERFEQVLKAADKHGIGVMVVFFTNGGRTDGKLGKQPEPDGTHNSGWRRQPAYSILRDKSKWGHLEFYVKTVVRAYAKDPRIICWDIFNEPGNIKSDHIVGGGKGLTEADMEHLRRCSLDLVRESAKWTLSLDPIQPITYCLWSRTPKGFEKVQIENSDILSFHSYGGLGQQVQRYKKLKKYNRPVLCTEWLGRSTGSTLNPILEFHKDNNIWSFAFGFVAGKMETWRNWPAMDDSEIRSIWFHDLYRADYTPYCPEEIAYIKRILKGENACKTPSKKKNKSRKVGKYF